jgi:hypothetical protein
MKNTSERWECIHNFVGETERERTLGKSTHMWQDNIKMDLKFCLRVYTGFIWLRKGWSCVFLWIRYWIFGFIKSGKKVIGQLSYRQIVKNSAQSVLCVGLRYTPVSYVWIRMYAFSRLAIVVWFEACITVRAIDRTRALFCVIFISTCIIESGDRQSQLQFRRRDRDAS